jgi:hypothetical protein
MTQSSMIRIGNAQAFWGDSSSAPARLVQQQPDLDYLTLDYLAEVSMSIMAIQREKEPTAGYARDFIEVLRSLIPHWQKGAHVKIITNAGGLNPLACAKTCQKILHDAGLHKRIGVIDGDDVCHICKQNADDPQFRNLENKEPLTKIKDRLVTANAYLGAQPIAKALLDGADIVITGRVADPSLTVAPCVAHFGWQWHDYDLLAQATVAGHLIECGTQATGGICTNWLDIPNTSNIGFPIVEVESNGSFVITKPNGTGGLVNIEAIKEQLLYEIGDPGQYLSPDATVSFLSLKLEQVGDNRIRVTGAKGLPPPPSYKVSATYRDGFKVEGLLTVVGHEAIRKAKRCGEIMLDRMKQAGYTPERYHVETLGAGAASLGVLPTPPNMTECVLRIALADPRQETLEWFAKEMTSLVTSGPQGVTGYISGRPHVRPVFGYWPCLISREKIVPRVQILEDV